MTIEQRVRDAIRQHTALVEPDPEGWERLQERYGAARRRRTQRRAAVVSLAASLLVFIGAMALFTGENSRNRHRVTAGPDRETPSSSTTSLPPTTLAPPPSAPALPPPTTAPPPARPTIVVAVSHTSTKDRVVALDAATGRTVRVLFEVDVPPDGAAVISGLALAPDGRSVWFGVGGAACEQYRVRRVPIGGGGAEEVAEGGSPAVSPNGRYLAYAARSSAHGGPPAEPWRGCLDTLVVRDLSTGVERVWLPLADGSRESSYEYIRRISWAPDGRRLVFDQVFEGSFVRVLDTSRPGNQREVSAMLRGSGSAEGLDDHLSPVWLPGGNRVAVAASCCYIGESPGANAPRYGEEAVVAIDVVTGAAEEVLRPSNSGYIVSLDVDSSGGYFLYTTSNGAVMMRTADGQQRVLARGFTEAVW